MPPLVSFSTHPGAALERLHAWRAYGIALLVLAPALAIEWLLAIAFARQITMLPCVMAIAVAAWYSGLGPAMIAMVGSIVFTLVLGAYRLDSSPDASLTRPVSLGFLVVAGGAFALMSESHRAAQRRTESGLENLLRQRQQLEAEIRLRDQVEEQLRQREEQLRSQVAALAESQRKTAESLALLDTLILHAPIGLALHDLNFRYRRVNQAMAEVNGLPIAEHLGRTLSEVLPSVPEGMMEGFKHVLATGEPLLDCTIRCESPRVPGELSTWQVSYYPVRVEATVMLGIGVVVLEITLRVAAEQKLRQSEERFRLAAEAVNGIIYDENLPAGCVERSRGMTEVLGHEPGSVPATMQWWRRQIHPDDIASMEERTRKMLARSDRVVTEYRVRHRNGHYLNIMDRALVRRDSNGQIVRQIGCIQDITEIRQAEEALRRGEKRFRLLAEAIPQMVWMATPEGDIEYYNQRWYEYTGMTFEQTRGQGWQDVVHPIDRDAGVEAWQTAVRFGKRHEVEQRLRRGVDGAYRWHLVRGVPLRDPTGAIIQWVGTITDIDDHRRQADVLERLVLERTAELQRSNRELEQFASVASHDLQEPLRKIQAFGDRLQLRCRDGLGDQGREYLERILNSTARMRSLINDILTFSRVTTNAHPFSQVNLEVVANEVISDLEGLIQQVSGQVEIGQLPEMEADPLQMRQLLQNLMGNGLKFRRPGTSPVVRVQGRRIDAGKVDWERSDQDWLELTVADNGIGFDEIYSDRIFQVFQRLHGRTEYEGTGMGLAICRKIVERHGGRVSVRSVPGEGSTFHVFLPLRQSREGVILNGL